ncbi:ABC transporter ATP-binding protein [Streptomyces sp. NPDC096030]|uniref:ABC transporter ATP-binding protein n=1 Tax=Streptomyces sp. NPDC096030 TaxID=3155423 RepID=UPI003327BFB3
MGVDASIAASQLAVITGPPQSGKTSLLLALAGRFRLDTGHVHIPGSSSPHTARELQRRLSVARARPAIDLDERLQIEEIISERRAVAGRVITPQAVNNACDVLGLAVPPARTLLSDLTVCQRTLLCLALAVAEKRDGLIIDDVDLGLNTRDSQRIWHAMRAVTDQGQTVIATALNDLGADVTIRLGTHRPLGHHCRDGATSADGGGSAVPADPEHSTGQDDGKEEACLDVADVAGTDSVPASPASSTIRRDPSAGAGVGGGTGRPPGTDDNDGGRNTTHGETAGGDCRSRGEGGSGLRGTDSQSDQTAGGSPSSHPRPPTASAEGTQLRFSDEEPSPARLREGADGAPARGSWAEEGWQRKAVIWKSPLAAPGTPAAQRSARTAGLRATGLPATTHGQPDYAPGSQEPQLGASQGQEASLCQERETP